MNQFRHLVEHSIVQVLARGEGLEGLGVICNGYIFTAAHCLNVDYEGGIAMGELRYQKCKPCDGEEFWADILFVDAVSDLAVLCCPDPQSAHQQSEAYDKAIESRGIALYRDVPSEGVKPMAVRIRNKDGWVEGSASYVRDGRVFIKASTQIVGGASGGPIVNATNNELVAINSQ